MFDRSLFRRAVLPSRRAALGLVAAAAAGALVWLSFPPVNLWPAAVVGVAGFTAMLRSTTRREAGLCGYAFGLGLWAPMLSFLHDLAIVAWVAVTLIESLWFVAMGLAIRRLWQGRWPWVGLTVVWVLQEYARDHWPFGGFPWGRLAFGQSHGPLLPWAAIGGAPLVTGLVAAAGTLLLYVFVDLSHWQHGVRAGARRLLVASVGLGAIFGIPFALTVPTRGDAREGPATTVVAAIQGNVPRLGLDEYRQARAVTQNHVVETRALADAVDSGRAPAPQLVIWPENASDFDPFDDETARTMIDEAVSAIGEPIVVGAVLDGPGIDHVRNAAIVWTPSDGPTQLYIKRKLVPFGEYIPWRGFVSHLSGRFALVPNDFVAGHRPGLLRAGSVSIADTICYEIADDSVVRQAVTAGGRLLVLQTNNADYEHQHDSGDGGETAQQLAIAQFRAVEHGRAVVVAATSGVSAIVAPNGHILARTGVFRAGYLDMTVPLRDGMTVADHLGPWPERAVSGLALLLLAIGPRLRRRRPAQYPSLTARPHETNVVSTSASA